MNRIKNTLHKDTSQHLNSTEHTALCENNWNKLREIASDTISEDEIAVSMQQVSGKFPFAACFFF